VPAERLRRSYFRAWLYQNGQDVARVETAYPAATRLLGVPRYLWRSAAHDAAAAAGAALTFDSRRRFAALVRLIWLAGYARGAWSVRTAPAPVAMETPALP
jgi:hypothetical protein